jgi:hypothetical protein
MWRAAFDNVLQRALTRAKRRVAPYWNALFLDLPYIVDSVWRRAAFNGNRWFSYCEEEFIAGRTPSAWQPRPYYLSPQFCFSALITIFIAYGPTLDSFCSIFGAAGMVSLHRAASAALYVVTAALPIGLMVYGHGRAQKRFEKANVPVSSKCRRVTVYVLMLAGSLLLATPVAFVAKYLNDRALAPVCHIVQFPNAAWVQLAAVIAALLILGAAARRHGSSRAARTATDFGVFAVLTAGLWYYARDKSPSEAAQMAYPHIYAVLALLFALIAMSAPLLSRLVFYGFIDRSRALYTGALADHEIFQDTRDDPDANVRHVVLAVIVGVYHHINQLLLFPALLVLIVPTIWLGWAGGIGLTLAVMFLSLGSMTPRWYQLVLYIHRVFFLGTPLVVSVAVIVLAALRLYRVQYVATVLDAAPFGVIFVWIVMTYVLFWWFEYAVNAALGLEMLRLLGKDDDARRGRVTYVAPSPLDAKSPSGQDRWIAVHGIGYLTALGSFKDPATLRTREAFQPVSYADLFSLLTPAKEVDTLNEFKRRQQTYFITLNAIILGCVWLLSHYVGYGDAHNSVQPAAVAAAPPPRTQLTELTSLLTMQALSHRPAIVVAASGGGTRAALFTASALEGLAKLNADRDIVLVSGVSGGGVASAYYYAHRSELSPHYSASAWSAFKLHMTDPFIGDVLEGSLELRVMSAAPLGVLLKESFERQLFDGVVKEFGDARRPALILNTTITGSPQEDSALLRNMFWRNPAEHESCDERHRPYANISGGRLIFTNLADRTAFPISGSEAAERDGALAIPDVRLPYVVVQDPHVALAAAAALTANFPPVFTNARVTVPATAMDDECASRSYYVTDGGATENLGLVSSLFALKHALLDIQKTIIAEPNDDPMQLLAAAIPDIHLVILEASASTYDYTPDRGVDALSGGSKERLTGGLTQELLNEIQGILGASSSRITIHDLAMPLAFRSRGGLGTNWMFPETVEIENPRTPRPDSGHDHWFSPNKDPVPRSQSVDRQALMDIWTGLFDPDVDFCGSKGLQAENTPQKLQIAQWVCGWEGPHQLRQDLFVEQWRETIKALRAR